MKRFITVAALAIIATNLAHARAVRLWSTKDLCLKADAVVIAVVQEIKKTGQISEISIGDKDPRLKTIERIATLKVLQVVKGNTTLKECLFKFETLDPKQSAAVINGPSRIVLEPKNVYVFFMKRESKKGPFVGVLSGDYDDDQAVKRVINSAPIAWGGRVWGRPVEGVRLSIGLESVTHKGIATTLPVVYIQNTSNKTIYFEQGGGKLSGFGYAHLSVYDDALKIRIADAKDHGYKQKPSPFGPSETRLDGGHTLRLEPVDDRILNKGKMIGCMDFYLSKSECFRLWSNVLDAAKTKK